jgi:cyclopropane-fatty-acyl-phospholipid synthase
MPQTSLSSSPATSRPRRNLLALNVWEAVLSAALDRIVAEGALVVRLPDGRQKRFGKEGGDSLAFALHDDDAVRRLATDPELALGELYMDGRLTVRDDDIDGLIALLSRNLRAQKLHLLATPSGLQITPIRRRPRKQSNSEGRARRNAAHHYDLPVEFYRLFLDRDLQYSCAYFESDAQSLDDAQEAKKELIARKLLLAGGETVLDIGCGWGGLALHLGERFGARVRGVTLAQSQQKIAQARAEERGLSDKVEFALEDYRQVAGQFDRIVSVGMFEHVGRADYDAYFQAIADRLQERGVALVHTIGRAGGPGATSRWIDRYIFPGGYIPALSEVAPSIEKSGLIITDIEVWRLHYAHTLRAWRRRFEAALPEVRAMFDERFGRMWRFYLAGAECAFREGDHVVFQIQLARRKDSVPTTRTYLCGGPGRARSAF